MIWLKQHAFEFIDDKGESVRVYMRFRSDGSLWYQVISHPDLPHEHRLEDLFKWLLAQPVPEPHHSGWSMDDFDEDFEWRLSNLNNKKIPDAEWKHD